MATALATYRAFHKLTLEQLARRCGVSTNYLSEIESGGSCSLPVAVRISWGTEGMVTPEQLYKDSLNKPARRRPTSRKRQVRKRRAGQSVAVNTS